MFNEDTFKRHASFSVIVILILILFIGRLTWFQITDAKAFKDEASSAIQVTKVIKAIRGNIVDSNGNILATTISTYDINIDPVNSGPVTLDLAGKRTEFSKKQIAIYLARKLKINSKIVLEKMNGGGRYANLKKNASAASYTEIYNLDIPWIYFDAQQTRYYPQGAVAGNLLGFMGSDGTALAGIERTMNSCLAGSDGKETYEQGADYIKIPESIRTLVPVSNGSDVVLTINSDLQYAAQQEVSAAVRRLNANWASAIVLEVATGKILAAAEAPTVDPNKPGAVRPENRASRIFQTAFEPGSILKTVAAATAIDVGKATPLTHVVAPQSLRMPWGQYINDAELHAPERLTLTGVLAQSSNTGIVQIGGKVDSATRYEYMKKFGMGEKTGVNFEGESSGVLSNYTNWDKMTDKVVMFGQGVSLTPIQTADVYQTIANQGVRVSPQLVAGCRDANGNLSATAVEAPVRVLSEKTASETMDMLEKVVEKGPIGRTARIPGYRIAGKTGTAQIAEGRIYGGLHAISFVGIAPADNPKYVVAVTAYKSRNIGNSLGATPIFVAVMKQVLKTYAVPPATTQSKNIPTGW